MTACYNAYIFSFDGYWQAATGQREFWSGVQDLIIIPIVVDSSLEEYRPPLGQSRRRSNGDGECRGTGEDHGRGSDSAQA